LSGAHAPSEFFADMARSKQAAASHLTAEWSSECWALYEHWLALRDCALLPTSERFLDTLPPRFTSSMYILEVKEDELLLRFQGSALVERWGADRTGLDIAAHRSEVFRKNVRALMASIVKQPCGYHSHSTYSTSRGRMMDAHYIGLPLAVQAGRPLRMLAYTCEYTLLKQGEGAWDQFQILEHGWIDIGAGVPQEMPAVLGDD
jgi:hypothetical protein